MSTLNGSVSPPRSVRFEDIDRAKGVAIFLVVLGHIVAREPPRDADWYLALKHAIYGFHMSFFMCLSGAVFFLKYRPMESIATYFNFVGGRFSRLMPAYFLFALIVLTSKLVAMKFVHVDNPPDSMASIFEVLVSPMTSTAAFLWYVYCLFLICALVPILLWMTGERLWLVLVFAVGVHFVPLPHTFALFEVGKYLQFFILGGYVMRYYDVYTQLLDRFKVLFFCAFAIGLAMIDPAKDAATLLGILSLPALHALVRMPLLDRSALLALLGAYSFPIYLMNTLAIGGSKALVLRFWSWDGGHFLVVAPILLVAGLALPILVKKVVFVRLPIIDRITN